MRVNSAFSKILCGRNSLNQSTEILIDQIPLGILTFSLHGRVEFINQNFHRLGLLYQFNTSLLNINIFKYNIFPPTNMIEELRSVTKGKPFEKEIKQVKTSDGKMISLILKGSPIYDDDSISGGMILIEDLQIQTDTDQELKTKLTDEYINKGDIFFIVTDTSGDIKYSAGKEIQGSKLLRKEITGRNIKEIFTSSENQNIIQSFHNAVQYGKSQFLKIEFFVIDISKKFDCTVEPVINENGFVQVIYLVFKESPLPPEEIKSMVERVTKLDLYNEISRRSETNFLLVDNKGLIIEWDEQFGNFLGIEKSVKNIPFPEIFPSINHETLFKIYQQLNDENSCELTTYIKTQRNEFSPINLIFYKSKKDNAQLIVLCSRIKLNSAVIKQSEVKPVLVEEKIESIIQPACSIKSDGTIFFTNDALLSLLGYQYEESGLNNLFEVLSEEDRIKLAHELSSLKVGEKKAFPVRCYQKSGSKIDLTVIVEGKGTNENKISSANCFFSKMNHVVQTSSEHIYQAMFETATDGIAIELNDIIVLANTSFAKIFGYESIDELKGKNILELISDESLKTVDEYLKKKRASKPDKERLEFLGKKKDGLPFFVEFCTFELKENQKQHLVLMARDVSERKRMQEAAKDSEQKYRNIAENIDDLLYTFERFDDKMYPTYYSKAIEKITGYTQTDFLSDQRLFLKIIHPDDFKDMKKRLSFLWRSDVQATTEFEFRIINKSGNIVWIRNKINIVRDAQGIIKKIYGLISDITFNKRAEEELRQSAANLKKLNDAKDRFLSIISHDLRAPFSSILGFTDLLLEDDTLTDIEKEQYISYIQDSSKSMLSLVNSMLDWTRLQTGRIKFEPEKLNAREIIESSISTISGTALKKGIEIENLVVPSLYIFGDKNLVLQVFNNLLSNAVKFTKLGDRIMISVNASQTSRFVTFSIKDTGVGIRSNNLEKLFSIETKFTSEGTAGEKGSGLGLSLVKEIVEKHAGSIEVLSEFEKGTEFIFTLPVASTKILLIDPNSRERMFYSKVLINITSEYAINVVSNGKEALERIIQSPPALVITEHKMPIMGGLQLVEELIKHNLKDAIPVIVLTGDIERSEIQEYTNLGIQHIFNKPVNLISLKAAMEKLLKKKNTK